MTMIDPLTFNVGSLIVLPSIWGMKMAGRPQGMTRLERFEGLFERNGDDECWPWKTEPVRRQSGRGGYAQFMWEAGPPKTQVMAHRASWRIYRGEIPEGMHVCHSCDNRRCVNPNHLFLGTARDNTLDMIAKNRAALPFRAKARLTKEQVVAIYLDDRWYGEIAPEYGIGRQMVGCIKRGGAYRDITEPLGRAPRKPRGAIGHKPRVA
jgi:hypothetical protein